jgi:hypothetical protein
MDLMKNNLLLYLRNQTFGDMNRTEFKVKYGVPVVGVKSFYDCYVVDLKVKNRNPAKILRMCNDLPFKWLSEVHPIKHRRILHYISLIEHRIAFERTNDPFYYKTQIKPFLDE